MAPKRCLIALMFPALSLGPLGLAFTPTSFAHGSSITSEEISGTVKDSLGNTLGHVLVLLTPAGPASGVRTAVTGADGRYRFDGVNGGKYRITALKDGYTSAVGRISAIVGHGLDLVLAPVPGQGVRPKNPDWILAAPPRDLLREEDALASMLRDEGRDARGDSDALARSDDAAAGDAFLQSSRAFLRSLTGRVEQTFSESQPGGASDEPVTGGTGMKTSLVVGSPIGQRATWDFQGQRERESTTFRDARLAGLESNAERLKAGFRYDTGEGGTLGMRAFYDHDAIQFDQSVSVPKAPEEIDRVRRSWGYNADWAGVVGSDAALQVDLGYVGSDLGALPERNGRRGEELDSEQMMISKTTLFRTSARVSQRVGASHKVDVGVRARVYSFGEAMGRILVPSPAQEPSFGSQFGRDGWTVNVTAAESWSISRPVSLDLGFDVSRRAYSAGGQSLAVVPQIGLVMTSDRNTTVRGVVSYVASRHEAPYGTTEMELDRENPLGYRLRVEQKAGPSVMLSVEAESRPLYYDFIGGGWEGVAAGDPGRSVYLSDFTARVSEARMSMQAVLVPGVVLGLGAGVGHVEGLVAATSPDDEFTRSLSEGDLHFVRTHVDGKIERTGTDVRIEIIRLDERGPGDEARSPYADRRVELQLVQDLAFIHPGSTDWTFLLSYRSFTPDDSSREQSLAPAETSAWNSRSRISGGVSVRF